MRLPTFMFDLLLSAAARDGRRRDLSSHAGGTETFHPGEALGCRRRDWGRLGRDQGAMPSSPSRAPTSPPAAFDRLLFALDPDRHRAGERYETLRRKLIRLFSWRGAQEPEQCADETLDRVARRLVEGAAVPDVFGFCHGVAMNVLREHWRRSQREPLSLDGLPAARVPVTDPAVEARRQDESRGGKRGSSASTDASPRSTPRPGTCSCAITRRRRVPREGRQRLAEELGVPMNALRIRVHRIRTRLARCIQGCLARNGPKEMDEGAAP
jgi:DNA-directed RNA polymerase specialized sigma24 family protein